MFSKPALFPKTPEPQNSRSAVRPGTTGTSGMVAASGLSAARSVADERRTETELSPLAGQSDAAPSDIAAIEQRSVADEGSRLIVGPNVKLKGAEILDCDTLVVEGRVEATMDSRVIRIAENGSFSGTVGIDVAEVHGRFEGELTARSQLVIHATGRVSGKIRYGKILIEEGGEISGDVQSLTAARDGGKEGMRAVVRDEPAIKLANGS